MSCRPEQKYTTIFLMRGHGHPIPRTLRAILTHTTIWSRVSPNEQMGSTKKLIKAPPLKHIFKKISAFKQLIIKSAIMMVGQALWLKVEKK